MIFYKWWKWEAQGSIRTTCYQAFYQAQVTDLPAFLPTAETRGRALFPPAEARKLRWVQINLGLYEAALVTHGSTT